MFHITYVVFCLLHTHVYILYIVLEIFSNVTIFNQRLYLNHSMKKLVSKSVHDAIFQHHVLFAFKNVFRRFSRQSQAERKLNSGKKLGDRENGTPAHANYSRPFYCETLL